MDKRKVKKKHIIVLVIVMILLNIYNSNISNYDPTNTYHSRNVKIFKYTPAWNLAKAVKSQNILSIRAILFVNPKLVDYQDPKYGYTVLHYSARRDKYSSAKTLLKLGANPNIKDHYGGSTPLYIAAEDLNDDKYKDYARLIELLVQYDADPNIIHEGYTDTSGSIAKSSGYNGYSPLMISVGRGIEKTKALIEGGANVNITTAYGTTAATKALYRDIEYAKLIIIENKADVSKQYNSSFGLRYPVELLRSMIYDLDSEEYKIKMALVEEFSRQGIDYWEIEIPENKLETIKRRYPNTWEEYVKVY